MSGRILGAGAVVCLLLAGGGCAPKTERATSVNPETAPVTAAQTVAHAPPQAKMSPALAVKPATGAVSSAFGQRKLPAQRRRMRNGIDLQARRGTPVVASADGTVQYVGSRKGYGNVVILEHENGVQTLYAHLDATTVRVGSQVYAGERLGTVGRTGRTTGANLHFEVLIAGKAVDPAQYVDWM